MIKYELLGTELLATDLQKKSETDFKKVLQKSILEIRNRAVGSGVGGTPVDTSELRMSAGVSADGSMFGYTKHYAPHVEHGHRTSNGRYVPGQYFLRANVNIQQEIFRADLIAELRK